jgi:hypothetical protein
MPNSSTPCGRATHKTALQTFAGWPARKAVGLLLSSTPLDTPHRMGLIGGRGWKSGEVKEY